MLLLSVVHNTLARHTNAYTSSRYKSFEISTKQARTVWPLRISSNKQLTFTKQKELKKSTKLRSEKHKAMKTFGL